VALLSLLFVVVVVVVVVVVLVVVVVVVVDDEVVVIILRHPYVRPVRTGVKNAPPGQTPVRTGAFSARTYVRVVRIKH